MTITNDAPPGFRVAVEPDCEWVSVRSEGELDAFNAVEVVPGPQQVQRAFDYAGLAGSVPFTRR